MNVSTTSEADVVCKDLIGEAYEAAHNRFPDFAGFSGLDALWEKVEDALKFDFSTTGEEDRKGMTILKEALEEAYEHGEYRDLHVPDVDQLWGKLMKAVGVEV